ncbi:MULTISPECIES: hypothetical protein [Bacillaceae]|uniref:hypothetical protein n=1 Tax=Bacillaceae TaxID=186817 RepID=UPI0015FF61E5|nr:hypothetical protein [Bacillus sp. PK3_68]
MKKKRTVLLSVCAIVGLIFISSTFVYEKVKANDDQGVKYIPNVKEDTIYVNLDEE